MEIPFEITQPLTTNVKNSNLLTIWSCSSHWQIVASRRIRKNIHLSFIFHNFFVLGGVSISIQKGTTRHLLLQYINLKKMSSDSHFYQFSFSYSLFLRITFAKLSILLKLESEKSHQCTFWEKRHFTRSRWVQSQKVDRIKLKILK